MRNTFGWLLAFICMCSFAAAQVRVEPRPAVRPGAAPAGAPATAPAQPNRNQAGQHGSADQEIAAFIYGCARNEVELSKFAQQHAKADEVRDFAAMMVKDHQPQEQKMAKLAGNLVNVAASETRTETRRVDPDAKDERRDDARRDDTRREDARKEGPTMALAPTTETPATKGAMSAAKPAAAKFVATKRLPVLPLPRLLADMRV